MYSITDTIAGRYVSITGDRSRHNSYTIVNDSDIRPILLFPLRRVWKDYLGHCVDGKQSQSSQMWFDDDRA